MSLLKNVNYKKILLEIFKILISVLATLTINTSLDKNITNYDGNSIFYIIEFILIYSCTSKAMKKVDKRMLIFTSILAFWGAGIEVVCYSINNYMSLQGLFETRALVKKNIISFIGLFLLFNLINVLIFKKINTIKEKLTVNTEYKKTNLFIYWGIIFICWIPYYLNYFPGLTTSDSMLQIYQSLGISSFTAHHPIVHTAFIGIFMNIGKMINNYTVGVALYTLAQMIIMSFIFALAVYVMKKRKLPKLCVVIALAFYAIYPINALFSLMMWKDIIFAGIMLIYTIVNCSLINDPDKFMKNNKRILGYTIVMVALMFFRNNGLYVIILTLPFALVFLNRYWKKIILMFLIAILSYYTVNIAVMSVFNIEKGEIREALSIPMQQMARVVAHHKDELSEEQLSNIKKYIKADNIEELYNPVISDPIKNHFDSNNFSNNKFDFIKLWLSLLKKYPTEYVESFICNSYGYYYPEAQHWVANRTMEKDDILNLKINPLVEVSGVKKIDSLIERRDIPLISMFFSIGFMFWLIIVALVYSVYNKCYKNILIYIPVIMLWLTTLASPVFCEFRYVYSIVTCLPILTMIILKKKE